MNIHPCLGTSNSKLVIQVRMTRVDDVNATGFTALAVREGNAETVQVNLLSPGNKLRNENNFAL
jgi:hypothetical protein